MRLPIEKNGPHRTPPQTEDAEERGFVEERDDEDLGKSEELDNDEAGDIADEGPGHRG